ncbi:hypothetical protein [Halobellus limi]|uniref:Uncharacterized protein n=1 Tax=Halobellus limi TaxID=699433 RepID=A0A1H5ZM17_9EURY|nr:hypothetical protein [Halobellus limi]QCC48025.1 hypothetical protein DV707_10360 [Halobellus limi]SEG37603.1 hypothetical protein SAMN04488133_2080 [Halobellus limi]
MSRGYPYAYPPDRFFRVGGRRISTTVVALALPVVVAGVDLLLFGFPETGIPYNYPLFGDLVLVWTAVLFLRLSHRVLWNIGDEFATLIRLSRGNPVSLVRSLTPEDIQNDLQNALYLAYHPAVLGAGAVLGGTFVSAIMSLMGVFEAYPYLGMNFGFGAAHGVFFGPVLGGAYVVVRAYSTYIADINLLDPNGVGGYRQIGNGIVKLATYAIGILTLDFVILSSVTFTAFERFQTVVSVLFLTVLAVVVVGTILVTVLVRRKLLQVRGEKVTVMRETFAHVEREYWRKYHAEENNLSEALNLLSMYAMFYQMSDMDMWPINLYSLLRLGASVSFSLAVYYLDLINSVESLASLL